MNRKRPLNNQELEQKMGEPCKVTLREAFGGLGYVPARYQDQLKGGASVKEVLLNILRETAGIGSAIDSEIRDRLKFEAFSMDDFDVDLDKREFWFVYPAYVGARPNLDDFNLFVDDDGALLNCTRTVEGGNRKRLKEVAEEFQDDMIGDPERWELEINGGYESPQICLSVGDVALSELPSLFEVSKLFDKIEKIARRG